MTALEGAKFYIFVCAYIKWQQLAGYICLQISDFCSRNCIHSKYCKSLYPHKHIIFDKVTDVLSYNSLISAYFVIHVDRR